MRLTRREFGGRRKALYAHFIDGVLIADGKRIDPITWRALEYAVRDATPEESEWLRVWLHGGSSSDSRPQTVRSRDHNEHGESPSPPAFPLPDQVLSSNFRRWKERNEAFGFTTSREGSYGDLKKTGILVITTVCVVLLVLAIVLAINAPAFFDAEGGSSGGAKLLVLSEEPSPYRAGVKVSGKAGKGKWPLKGIGEGTILCRWHEFAPGSRNPITRRPLVLFRAPGGQKYTINGAAYSAAAKGYVQAAPIDEVEVDQRLKPEVGVVINTWLDAGLALCEGNFSKAQRLAANANRMAMEPMSPGVEFELSSAEDDVRRRRIFFELVECQDKAWKAARDDLARMGRLENACFVMMREKKGLTKEELIRIAREGNRRHWPVPEWEDSE